MLPTHGLHSHSRIPAPATPFAAALFAAALAALAATVGCGPEAETIRAYDAPRVAAKEDKDRMLGAMLLRPTQAWFFKLTGPKDAVAGLADAFGQVVASVRFEGTGDDERPRWTLPAGWTEQPGSEIRFATLRTGGEGAPEVTVTKLPKPSGDDAAYVLQNLNRWRRQMSLPPIGPDEVAQATTSVKTKDGTALLVDLVGTASQGMTGGPFSGAR